MLSWLAVQELILNFIEHERRDRVGAQYNNQPNNAVDERVLRFFDLVITASRCHPEEATVEDDKDSNNTKETEEPLHDLSDRLFQIEVITTL